MGRRDLAAPASAREGGARVTDLGLLVWPKARAAEMVGALAAVSRLPVATRDNVGVTDIERIAARLDLEAEAVGASYASVDDTLKVAGPALVRLDDDELVALVGAR